MRRWTTTLAAIVLCCTVAFLVMRRPSTEVKLKSDGSILDSRLEISFGDGQNPKVFSQGVDQASGTGSTATTSSIKNLPGLPLRTKGEEGSEAKQDKRAPDEKLRQGPMHQREPGVIAVRGGLSARLRVIFYHFCDASQRSESLRVIWPIHPECPETFESLFQPVAGLTVDSSQIADLQYRNITPVPTHIPLVKVHLCDLECLLRPIPVLRAQIQSNIFRLGRYACVHITGRARNKEGRKFNPLPDSHYDEWIRNTSESTGISTVYVATDHPETQRRFSDAHDADFHELISNETYVARKVVTRIALIDAWTCSYADSFFGTPHSSFSFYIKKLIACRRGRDTGPKFKKYRGGRHKFNDPDVCRPKRHCQNYTGHSWKRPRTAEQMEVFQKEYSMVREVR